jgi:hypothetical protein
VFPIFHCALGKLELKVERHGREESAGVKCGALLTRKQGEPSKDRQ